MANYIYEKWNCVTNYNYSYYLASQVVNVYRDTQSLYVSAYWNYSFDNASGNFYLSSSYGYKNLVLNLSTGYTVYGGGGASMTSYKKIQDQSDERKILVSVYNRQLQSTTYAKGGTSYGTVIAEEGTLPANGRHTDGYWYVKTVLAGPNPPSALSGVLMR